MTENIGTRIRTARLRYGMSQAELARRIGLSTTAMNDIERGRTPDPHFSRVRTIAEIFHVSLDELAGFPDDWAAYRWQEAADGPR